MSKIKDPNKYLITQPEIITEKPSLVKNYILTPGTCKECTLEFNCRTNKTEILKFLKSLGLDGCGSGFCYSISENVKKVVAKSI